MKPPVSVLASLALSLLLPASALASTVNFSDGTFPTWFTSVETAGTGGVGFGSQVLSGGNPGAYRDVQVFTGSGLGGTVYLSNWLTAGVAVFTPSVSGPIAYINYSESSITLGEGTVQTCGMVLRQGGVVYYGPSFPTTPSWTTTNQTLTASDFDALAPGIQNPDFSPTGGVIEFGFYRGQTNSTPYGFGTDGGIDNWSVTVNYNLPVATEPTTWGKVKALYR